MKSEFNLIFESKILNKKQTYSVKMFLNETAKINVINQEFAMTSNFNFIVNELFSSQFMNDKEIYCYEIYEITLILKNFWQKKQIFLIYFMLLTNKILI